MTREEAIERLKNYTQYRCGGVDLVAINMAIQALESQPRFLVHSDGKIEQIIEPCGDVLDKIRDEICDIDDEIVLNPDSFYERKAYIRFSKVIEIIDKYKTESEVNNG